MPLRKRIVSKTQIPNFLESDVDLFLNFMGLKLFAVLLKVFSVPP
jgi:hypothetical protein